MSFEIINVNECPAIPWRNGRGSMRSIATHPSDASWHDFEWRVSVAEVSSESLFSPFPGLDRCIVLLSGEGFHLRDQEGTIDHCLNRPLAPFRFAGEAAITAEPVGGASENLSVLARRGRCSADCSIIDAPRTFSAGSPLFVLCVQGSFEMQRDGAPIAAMEASQAALWRQPVAEISLCPRTADARSIAVRFNAGSGD